MTDPHVASHEQEVEGRPSTGLLSRINAVVARVGMYLSVSGLLNRGLEPTTILIHRGVNHH